MVMYKIDRRGVQKWFTRTDPNIFWKKEFLRGGGILLPRGRAPNFFLRAIVPSPKQKPSYAPENTPIVTQFPGEFHIGPIGLEIPQI